MKMIWYFPEILKLYLQIYPYCWFLRHWLENLCQKPHCPSYWRVCNPFVGNSEDGMHAVKEEKGGVMSWAKMDTVEILPEES